MQSRRVQVLSELLRNYILQCSYGTDFYDNFGAGNRTSKHYCVLNVKSRRVQVLSELLRKKNLQCSSEKTSMIILVRVTGLEPARLGHQNLNLARLPIPPYPHIVFLLYDIRRHLSSTETKKPFCRSSLLTLFSPKTQKTRENPAFLDIFILILSLDRLSRACHPCENPDV